MSNETSTKQYLATVLHVDDDLFMREVIRLMLESQNIRVIGANSGDEALSIFKQHTVDVAVLDVSMPKMDGFELLKELRKLKPALPVIMLTGVKDDKHLFLSLRHKCNSLLEKPCSAEILISHIQRFLKAPRNSSDVA